MGDARLDYDEIIYGFFDRFLKGEETTRLDTLPKVTLLHDGHRTSGRPRTPGRPRARSR